MMLLIATALPSVGKNNKLINGERKGLFITSENGIILNQKLDENNKGYSVIRVWGSDYEMGYAQAELLGDYIVQIVNENKDFLGGDYDYVRGIIADAIWMPSGIEDEFNGIADCLAITHPSENIDALDLKVVNTIGDWAYTGCRSHTCWGRYVSAPIKTLSTFRLDSPAIYSAAYHHVLCVRVPGDGSPKWVNLAWPGYLLTMSGVNEFGTMISNNDYQSSNNDFSSNRMPRMVAFRHATTFATDPDVSTHLNTVYSELQNYEIMTGTFLSYYAPEGYGGVMTCNPYESGPDFYHLRLPQESWHHGEAMICTNDWTDGTFTPPDEDFGADAYYDDETPKTQETHWELLASFSGARGLHMLNVAFRDHEDMTIWAIGKLSSVDKTPRLEYEWNVLFYGQPPNAPTIDGSLSGYPGTEYDYIFNSVDPDGNDVKYYIDWGDDTSEVTDSNPSGTDVTVPHTWTNSGKYTITAYAEDSTGLAGQSTTFQVIMPRNKVLTVNMLLLRIFERFPLLQKLLQHLGFGQ